MDMLFFRRNSLSFFFCDNDTAVYYPISLHILSAGIVSSLHLVFYSTLSRTHVGFFDSWFKYLLCENVKMQKTKGKKFGKNI